LTACSSAASKGAPLMTKGELIESMAEKTSLPKAAAKKFLDAFVDAVAETLKSGDKVVLTGFGTFAAPERKARTGRNPRTGEEIAIPAGKTPKFKAAKSFKEKTSRK